MPREISLTGTSPTFSENNNFAKNENSDYVGRKKKRRIKLKREITGLLSAEPAEKNIII